MFTLPKTRAFGLPFGEKNLIADLFLMKLYHDGADRQMDRPISITELSRVDA